MMSDRAQQKVDLQSVRNGSGKDESFFASSVYQYAEERQCKELVRNLIRAKKEIDARSPDGINVDTTAAHQNDTIQAKDSQEIPTAIDRFEIKRVLGSGAFADVYLAHDPVMDREVALKVPRVSRLESEHKFDQMIEEARSAAVLTHQSIVVTHDVVRADENTFFLVMEYVSSGNLRQVINQGKCDHVRAVEIVSCISRAVHIAHKRQIYHRDIKPENILLDDEGTPKIADFGLAITAEIQSRRAGEVAGTFEYMSPEQFRGESNMLDGRSDIWSIGVIFYELLTGQRPFIGKGKKLVEQIESRDAKPPRQLDDSIPRELERICLKCLSNSKIDRYTTARDLAFELDDWKSANADPNPRKRVILYSVLALVIALFAVTAMIFWFKYNASRTPWKFGDKTKYDRVYLLLDREPKIIRKPPYDINALSAFKRKTYFWAGSYNYIHAETGTTDLKDFDLSVFIWRRQWIGRAGILLGRKDLDGLEEYQMIFVENIGPDEFEIRRSLVSVDQTASYSFYEKLKEQEMVSIDNSGENHLVVEIRDGKLSGVKWNGTYLQKIGRSGGEFPELTGGFGLIHRENDTIFRNHFFSRIRSPKNDSDR